VFEDTPETSQPDYETFALGLEFVGANENPQILGEDRLPWNNNYFIGNDPAQWRTDVPNYGKIRFTEVYRGIDLVYYGNRKRVKYDFVVKPGEDPARILLKYDFGGYEGSLAVNNKGELVVKTPVGDMIEEKPYCYQRVNGKEVKVEVGYEVMEDGQYRFRVGEYDGRYDLIIDPELVYSTYLGGDTDEYVSDVAIDKDGYVYITGRAVIQSIPNTEDFPLSPGSYDTSYNGGTWDVFVTKLNRDGSQIIFSTLIGGNNVDESSSIALDSESNVIIAGKTISEDFPKTEYSYSDINDLFSFLLKLSANGKQMIFSSLFNGNCHDITIDQHDNIYVAGQPSLVGFFTTPGAYDRNRDYNWATTYMRKLTPDGKTLLYSTFIEACFTKCITCDDEGNAFIGGWTSYYEFPATPGAYDTTYSTTPEGAYQVDGFIAQLNPTGSNLVYATYFGGRGWDEITNVMIDNEENIVFCGKTDSNDLPVTENAPYPQRKQEYNVFISRIDIQKSKLLFSTYYGGASPTIALDAKNHIYLTGTVIDASLPVTDDAFYKNFCGEVDVFLAVFDVQGNLFYSTYWGGSKSESPNAIVINERGDVVIVGSTISRNFPVSPNVVDRSLHWTGENSVPSVPPSPDIFISVFSFEKLLFINKENGLPPLVTLLQPYPNPFNPITKISYYLPKHCFVEISVFSLIGQKIETLFSGNNEAGINELTWNAQPYPSGLYFIKITTNTGMDVRKVILLK
jgi:hypothetical protein